MAAKSTHLPIASFFATVVLFVGAGYTSACGSSAPGAGSGVGAGGEGSLDANGNPVGSGSTGSGTRISTGNGGGNSSSALGSGGNCGTQVSDMSRRPADLLLVLDKSGSMDWAIDRDQSCGSGRGSATCQKRWTAMTDALSSVFSSKLTGVRWGLKFFGSLSSGAKGSNWGCTVNPGVEVPIGDTNTSTIQQQIQGVSPATSTPTRAAINAAVQYYKTVNDGYPHYILLATDGEPNCSEGSTADNFSDPDVTATVAAIGGALTAGIKTYVVGIGPSTGNLASMAEAGGTTDYYPATTPEALTAALQAIAGQVSSCTFNMTSAPPDPANVAVYLDKNLLAKDPVNGWSFGSTAAVVNINGTACDGIKSGTNKAVEVRFGCPGETAPPSVIK